MKPILAAVPGAPRRARRRKQPEARIQEAIVAYLRSVLSQNRYKCFSIPNGGSRDKTEAAIMKGTGTLAGVPDIEIVGPGGTCWFFEVKNDVGKLTEPQEEFQSFCISRGVPMAVVRGIDDVKLALAQWRVRTREAS